MGEGEKYVSFFQSREWGCTQGRLGSACSEIFPSNVRLRTSQSHVRGRKIATSHPPTLTIMPKGFEAELFMIQQAC